ncbi:MAG: potassium channel protein [Elusimicrobiota bacterium]
MFKDLRERLSIACGIFTVVLLIGTCGYVFIEGWSAFDALYMTVITVATIGYGEVHPLSNAGRAFTIFLIFGGLGAVGYAFSSITAFIVEGELNDVLRRRRMKAKISALKEHYIVCGGGNTGRTIMEELFKTGRPFVGLELDAAKRALLEERGWLVLQGDALRDEMLSEAGIERAHGLFCALADDRDNSFVAVSARGLNPRLRIVSRLHDPSIREKLLRSGADAAVSPGHIGGMRMASEMVRPATVGFLDSMLREHSGGAYRFEDVAIPAGSPLIGKSLQEAKGSGPETALIVAVKGPAGYETNPSLERCIAPGESIVALGSMEQVRSLRARIKA